MGTTGSGARERSAELEKTLDPDEILARCVRSSVTRISLTKQMTLDEQFTMITAILPGARAEVDDLG